VELIEKVRASGRSLPVIMATGILPTAEFQRKPSLQPTATVVKPYTIAEFLGTVKSVLGLASSTLYENKSDQKAVDLR
jgi:hypothetical protein